MRSRRFRLPASLLATTGIALSLAGCVPDARALPDPGAPTPAASSTAVSGAGAPRVGSGSAAAALRTLKVRGRAPKTGYTREQFGQAWSDAVDVPGGHNGCDTRNDILRRDLTGETIKPRTRGCIVLTGTLHDPYGGATIAFRRGNGTSTLVQIDHVVALSNAWQTGAGTWSATKRAELGNDPLNLMAVQGNLNSAKGDGDTATWLPPRKAFRCTYVARQVAVKARYGLWVTAAEHDAMARILATCPGQPLPTEAQAAVPAPAGH
ncbi:MAG: HNH endonuclease family protein [Oryzihumus sp.]